LVELPLPPLSPNRVRVRFHAYATNYRDVLMILGAYLPRLPFPFIPGSDAAGEVVAVGEEVTAFSVGDRVCTTMIPQWERDAPPMQAHQTTLGGPAEGVFCESRDCLVQELMPLPDSISFAQGACLPVAGLTAYHALTLDGPLSKPRRVLLLGSGGVSLSALPLALHAGWEVALVTSHKDKQALIQQRFPQTLVLCRETQPQWGKALRQHWVEGADLVLEVGGEGTMEQSLNAVALGGTIALIGVLAKGQSQGVLLKAMMRNVRLQGILVGSRLMFAHYLHHVATHPEALPLIGRTMCDFSSISSALRVQQQAPPMGKIVVLGSSEEAACP
jgi:NADPH:quinone reductase-like Zn-dependent oxidoreductase